MRSRPGLSCPGSAAMRWAEPLPERVAVARRLNRRSGLRGCRAAGHLLRARSQGPLLLFKALAPARPLYWVTPRWAAASAGPRRGARVALAAADPAKSAPCRLPHRAARRPRGAAGPPEPIPLLGSRRKSALGAGGPRRNRRRRALGGLPPLTLRALLRVGTFLPAGSVSRRR